MTCHCVWRSDLSVARALGTTDSPRGRARVYRAALGPGAGALVLLYACCSSEGPAGEGGVENEPATERAAQAAAHYTPEY